MLSLAYVPVIYVYSTEQYHLVTMLHNVCLMLSAGLADAFIIQGESEEPPTQLKCFQEIKALLEKTSWVSRG